MLFSLGAGGGGDLLDFANVEAYWQMHDQRIVNVQTMTTVLEDNDATPADRLMAIRALGEVASAENAAAADRQAALALLGGLTDSEETFEAEYAARSIAWINGVDPAPRAGASAEQMAQDLTLLPEGCNFVGQWRLKNGVGPVDLDSLVPEMGGGGGRGGPFGDRDEMMQQISMSVLQFVGIVGNARLDAVTFGMSMTDDEPEYFTLVGRGAYSPIDVQIAIEDLIKNEGPGDGQTNLYSIGDTEIISYQDGEIKFAILMPSDEVIVWIMNIESAEPLAIDQTAQLIAAAGTEPAFTNELLMAEIAKIDRDASDVWLAMEVPAVMRQEAEEVFGPFTAAHITAVTDDEGTMQVAWEAIGDNADAVTQTTAFMVNGLAEGRAEMQEELQRMDDETKQMMVPLIQIMESIHIESEGTTMTGGLTVEGGPASGLMSLPFLMFMGI